MTRCCIALVTVLVAARLAGAQPLASVPPNTIPAKMCAGCADRSVRIPVTAASGFVPKEIPEVLDVVRAGLRLPDLEQEFQAAWELTAPGGTPRAILFRIGPNVRKAGVYDVLLTLQPKTQPKADLLNVQIEHPAARLQVPSKIILTKTRAFTGWSEDKPRLQFIEQSGLSPIRTAGVLWLTPAVQGNEPVTGRLELPATAAPEWQVPAGKGVDVPYTLAGHFPLGTVTGAVQITADELPEPVTLNYEVHTRWGSWLIILYALSGLVAGWMLKVFLKRRIQLEEARQKAGMLRARVLDDRARYPDVPFRSATDEPLRELETAARGGDPAVLETARQALETVWRGALQTLATRRQAAQTLLNEVRSITASRWSVPASIAAVVTRATDDVDKAERLLTIDDVAASDSALTALRRSLGAAVRDAALEWQTAVELVADALRQQAGLSAAVKTACQAEVETARTTYLILTGVTPADTVADQIMLLKNVSAAFRQMQAVFDRVRLRQATELEQATARLATVAAKLDAAALTVLQESAAKLAGVLEGAAEDPRAAAEAVGRALVRLNEAWRRALLNPLPEIAKPDVAAKLDAFDYVGAANATARALTGGSVILKDGAKTAVAGPAVDPASPFVVENPSTFVIYSGHAGTAPLPPAATASVFENTRQLLFDKGLQSLVFFVLISVAAVSVFGPTFSGDFADFAKVFFWAFGLDVTVDAMRDLLKPRPA